MNIKTRHFVAAIVAMMMGFTLMVIGYGIEIKEVKDELEECREAQPENCGKMLEECNRIFDDIASESPDGHCLELLGFHEEIIDDISDDMRWHMHRANVCEDRLDVFLGVEAR